MCLKSVSANLQILVNAAIAESALGAGISDDCCYGDVKGLDRTVGVDLKCQLPTMKPLERLSTCDRHGCGAFVGDCELSLLAVDSFLLKHLVRHM